MSSLDSDHNHYAFDHPQNPSQPSSYNLSAYNTDEAIPPLPAYAYTPPSVKRPTVPTSFEAHNYSSVRANGITPSSSREEDSPDPHDFYRPHQNQFGNRSIEGLGQGDIRVERRDGGMTRHQQRPSPVTTRSNGTKGQRLPVLSSRINTSRYTSSPTSDRSPLSGAKSSPALSNTARNRQTSLKELVNKFNQTPDETPPLPRASTSRSPSTHSSSSNQRTTTRPIKPRTSSLPHRSADGSTTKVSTSTSFQSQNQRRGRTHDDVYTSPRSKRNQRTTLRTDSLNTNSRASNSMIDLAPVPAPDIGSGLRRPLFGELLASSPTHPDLGWGIPTTRRRRGSEGSMHSPNPMFPDDRTRLSRSPSSPSAWYLGATPTLEEIKTGSIPELPANMHRRTRSDFTGAPASRPPTSRTRGTNLSPPRDRDPPSSSSSTNTSKRNSQSRIPTSTRRMSVASDSSTASARTSSALGKTHLRSPTRPKVGPPKGGNPRSPQHHSRSSTPQRSPRRGVFNTGKQPASPRLTAFITSPMPKKSPPLRSSRPRQPVSSASTSASRARAVDRLSSQDKGSSKSIREARPRKPPELGAVDFAARRQKIQQAFTKSVIENERQEVERRASMALDSHSSKTSFSADGIEELGRQNCASEGEVNTGKEALPEAQEDSFRTLAEELPKSERELTINTGQLSERSVLDLSLEDSPTLGAYNRFSSNEGEATPPSEPEPNSAITAGTSDSVDTFFDDEPQDDSQNSSRRPSQEPQSLLSHIMHLRDSSSSPTSAQRPAQKEGSASEKDDQESIQIMLGETPIQEQAPFKEQYEERLKDPSSSEGPDNRWSMSSWTSSTRSRDERDAPMERIDEHSPSRPTQPNHLSISTSTSEQTQQLWSPASFASPNTARTTMDSDAYSTINRVLDHYHDPSLVSPEQMHDVQQQIITQSPDLARLGGWDPKKVTQLYLQELARGRSVQSNGMPDPLKFHMKRRTSPLKVPVVPEKEVSEIIDEKMIERMEREHEDLTPPSAHLDVDENDLKPARASLTGPDDWDMSPSLGGIHLQAEAADSPIIDEKPMLPPKDWRAAKRELAEMPEVREIQTAQAAANSRPQLPPIKGLGLAINIMPPQKEDSPTIPPPPLPHHSPPPPPVEPSPPIGMRSPPSPSIYSKHIPSGMYPNRASASDITVPPLPSNEPSRPSRSVASSIQPSASSSVSVDRPSVDGPPISTEATSKNSSPSSDQKRLTKRRHIIKELVDTEHSFGQDMKVVDDIYKGTSNVIIISPEDVKTLFGNSDQIVSFSTNFLDALKQASKSVYVLAKSKRWRSNRISNATSNSGNTDDQSSINGVELNDEDKDRKTFIGEAFGHHMTSMEKIYAEYLNNHDAANQKLVALQKNPKVQIWLKECRAYAHDLTSAWDLDSLLVKPVQRILKYPLLLDQLLDATPENHPDFTALDVAAREMKGISMRINEMKRRTDLMDQMTTTRKRKESDVRIGLSKAFGRRTERLKQQVGLSETVEDKTYATISDKFGSHFFQLQVVMRDVEMYTNDVQVFMNRFCDFALGMEAHIDVGQTSYPEIESKWRKFRQTTREMSMTALTDHVTAVRKNVIEPMTTLLKLHDGPQKLMAKRSKRVMDYARFKAIKDRGEKPDKKTTEQGEQFMVVNDMLKDELPKLFTLTGKLVEACLNNFVQLQVQWLIVWRKKLSQVIEDGKAPSNAQDIVNAFTGDFAFFEAQVLSLGVCNGSMLNDVMNFLSPSTTLQGDEISLPRQASSMDVSSQRTLSISSDKSPVLPQPDFGGRGSGSFFSAVDGLQPTGNQVEPSRRMRASSNLSGHSARTPEIPGSFHTYSNNTTPMNMTPVRPSATPRTFTEPSPSMSRPSVESPSISNVSEESTLAGRPISGTTYPSVTTNSRARASSPSRYSGFFSSAMPMSDSPRSQSPTPGQAQKDFNVIFLAASVYEFNIDRARKEAGYPYLTYVAGEIFDVIGEKGELWLAKNQDDATNLVGWIWNKHFVKLAG